MGRGAGVLYLFTTLLHTGALGALLTFAPRPWYAAYGAGPAAWGLTPLEDQQLAGLVMGVPASLGYLAAGLALLARSMREAARRTERREGRALLLSAEGGMR